LLVLDKNYIPGFNITGFDTDYTLNLYLLDKYDSQDRQEIEYPQKQTDLERLAKQFLLEFVDRQENGSFDWILTNHDSVTVSFFDRTQKDSLIGLQLTLTIKMNNDCQKGVFKY